MPTVQKGGDTVEFRVPARLTDSQYGGFSITAETLIDGTVVETWSESGTQRVSSAHATGADIYVRFLAVADDPDLPTNVPASNNTRGGGYIKVKTGGGGDPPGGRPR